MNRLTMMKEALKMLNDDSFKDKESLQDTLYRFLEKIGVSNLPPPQNKPDVINKSEPTFDTLDFDEISSHFDSPT